MVRKWGLLGATAIVACSLWTGAASAQATGSEAPRAETPEEAQDIVITARKRSETILEVPASVAVVDSQAIDRLGITNFQDLQFVVPNVTILSTSNIAGRTQVTIRGIPDRAGIYVDDVFVGDSSGINGLLVDIDRVEVLRGPQGTLFGRNSISGAINTVTRKPSATFYADALARIGNYDQRYFAAVASGPITDHVRVKVSGAYKSETSYDQVRNLPPQKMTDSAGFLGQISVDLGPEIVMLASIDYLRDAPTVVGVFDAIRDYGGNGNYFKISVADGNGYDRITPEQNRPSTSERDSTGGFLRFDWTHDTLSATSITAARDIDFLYQRDGDYSKFHLLDDGYQPVSYNSFSQEVRLNWTPSPAFSVLAGGYYFKDHRISRDRNTIGNDFVIAQASTPTFAAYAPAFAPGGTVGGVTNGRLAASPELRALVAARLATNSSANLREFGRLVGLNQIDPEKLGVAETFSDTRLDSLAFFGSVTVKPFDGLEITGGLRYTRELINAAFGRSVVGLYQYLSFVNPRFDLPQATDTDFSPNATVKYQFSPNFMVYASFAKGFRSGGYNTSPGAVVLDPVTEGRNRKFLPEKVTNYEIGTKFSVFDGRLFVSAAAFKMDYKDLQRVFYRTDPVTGQFTQTLNTTATSKGFEIETSFKITSGITGALNYGHAESTYDDYPLGPVNTTTGVQQVVLTGRTLPFAPRNTITGNLRFQEPVSDRWQLFGSGDVQYRSAYTVNDYNNGIDPEIFIGGTTLLNASLGLINDKAGLTITARVNNLTDQIFRTNLNLNSFPGAVQQALSAPRTFSIEVRKRF